MGAGSGDWRASRPGWQQYARPLAYGALNIAAASGIVFANKVVFATYGFKFTCALTWVHTLFTLAGMRAFLAAGMFAHKPLPQRQLAPLAAAYVGYIVLCNLSLNINTVSFYQVMKIAVAPTVMLLELLLFRVVPPLRVAASVGLVCLGVAAATVSDTRLVSNARGLLVGLGATLVTALYQLWAGSKQKELGASSMQLLHGYTPQAALMLGLLVPLLEPLGRPGSHDSGTLLGYRYTPAAVGAILLSAVLGLLVSLSTFLVIGATSSLTYNVVGHLKTIIILAGGCLFFGDEMPPKKLAGVCVAMAGIIWYTQLKLQPAPKAKVDASKLELLVHGGSSGGAGGGRAARSPTPAAAAGGVHPTAAGSKSPVAAAAVLPRLGAGR